MKIKEAVQRVQSLYSRGVHTTDSRLTSRHIYSCLLTGRTTIITQKYNKHQKINDFVYQDLNCVELIPAQLNECKDVPAGSVRLRSKFPIPKFLTGINKDLIQAVTSMDGITIFDKTNFSTAKYNSGNKFTGKNPTYYFKGDYIYVTILKSLKGISIRGLFDDPIEAFLFPSLCDKCKECQDYNELEFPIDRDSLKTVLDIAKDELVILLKQMGADTTVNTSDDTEQANIIHQPNN